MQLTPGDSEIVDKHKAALSDAKAYVRKLSVVTLGDKAAKEDKDKEDDDAKDKNEVWPRMGQEHFQYVFMNRKIFIL